MSTCLSLSRYCVDAVREAGGSGCFEVAATGNLACTGSEVVAWTVLVSLRLRSLRKKLSSVHSDHAHGLLRELSAKLDHAGAMIHHAELSLSTSSEQAQQGMSISLEK